MPLYFIYLIWATQESIISYGILGSWKESGIYNGLAIYISSINNSRNQKCVICDHGLNRGKSNPGINKQGNICTML